MGCKHLLDHCALCSKNRLTIRGLTDIDGQLKDESTYRKYRSAGEAEGSARHMQGVPIPGYVATNPTESRGRESLNSCEPARPMDADFFTVDYPRPRLVGNVTHLPPVGRPWWVAKGLTFNPLTRAYVEGVPMDIEVPIQVLENVQEWEDIG